MQNSRTSSLLLRDTRGAVLVVGVVLGALLVGALWYLASIGDAIIWRESAQDAADATAFENAVWNARGMNVLVSINIVMSMVLAILVLWRVVMIAVAVGIYLSVAACAPTLGAGCAAAVTLTDIEIEMLAQDNNVSGAIIRILAAVNVVEMAVASATPLVSTAESTANTALAYHVLPVALSASLLPSINLEGIQNAVTCLASAKKDGAGGGATANTPGGSPKPNVNTPGAPKPDVDPPSNQPVNLNKDPKDPVNMNKDPAADPDDPCAAPSPAAGGPGGKPSGGKPPAGGAPAGTAPGGGAPGQTPLATAAEIEGWFNLSRMGMPVSLPVEDDSFSLLCNKAGAFITNNLAGAIEKGLVLAGVNQKIANFLVLPLDLERNVQGFITGLLPGVFCAPLGNSPVALKGLLNKGFKARCDFDFDSTKKKKEAADKNPDGNGNGRGGFAVGGNGVAEEAFPAPDGRLLRKKEWLSDCQSRLQKDTNKRLGGALDAVVCALPEIECGKPAKVWDFAGNGSIFMRSFGSVRKPVDSRRDDQALDVADGREVGNVQEIVTQPVTAHAEMYFECESDWGDCGPNAMWQIRWRARLRRVQTLETLLAASGESMLSGSLKKALGELASIDPVNGFVSKLANKILGPAGPGVSELKDNPIFDAILGRAMDWVSDKLGSVASGVAGAVGSVADAAGSPLQDPAIVADRTGASRMGEARPGRRDDSLRAFIRSHADRSATIH